MELPTVSCISGICDMCKRSGQGLLHIFVVRKYKVKEMSVCPNCINAKEFFYLDKDHNMKFNMVYEKISSDLSRNYDS